VLLVATGDDLPVWGHIALVTPLLIVLGFLLLAAAIGDAVTTTLIAGAGGGPLTRVVSQRLWRGLLRISRSRDGSSTLTFGGPAVLLSTVLIWVLLLWAGWAMVFATAESNIVDSTSRTPTGVVERVYFAGYTVFTLGLGDYIPTGAVWQILTAIASFSGLFLVTLSITYLLSVVTAVVAGRRFAASLHLYGDTGADLVLLYCDEGELGPGLATRLQSLAEEVVASAQQHLAYPVLHFFHATDERSSTPRALAALDDALLLAASGVARDQRPPASALRPLRTALDFYVETVEAGTVRTDERPPVPDLGPLREAGLPVVDDDEFAEAVAASETARSGMLRLLISDGRQWPTRPVARPVDA
jgi:hypothetical protein